MLTTLRLAQSMLSERCKASGQTNTGSRWKRAIKVSYNQSLTWSTLIRVDLDILIMKGIMAKTICERPIRKLRAILPIPNVHLNAKRHSIGEKGIKKRKKSTIGDYCIISGWTGA